MRRQRTLGAPGGGQPQRFRKPQPGSVEGADQQDDGGGGLAGGAEHVADESAKTAGGLVNARARADRHTRVSVISAGSRPRSPRNSRPSQSVPNPSRCAWSNSVSSGCARDHPAVSDRPVLELVTVTCCRRSRNRDVRLTMTSTAYRAESNLYWIMDAADRARPRFRSRRAPRLAAPQADSSVSSAEDGLSPCGSFLPRRAYAIVASAARPAPIVAMA